MINMGLFKDSPDKYRFKLKGTHGMEGNEIRKIGSMIIVDKKTGVQYLYINEAYNGSGVTVIVDENGKPLLEKDDQ